MGVTGLTLVSLWDRITDVTTMRVSRLTGWVVAGDVAFLLGVTLAGELTHGLSLLSGRWLSTFVPLLVGWALTAPALELYQPSRWSRAGIGGRALWAALLATPMAAWLRGLWLQAPILPIFVLVLSGITGLTMAAWREGLALVLRLRKA